MSATDHQRLRPPPLAGGGARPLSIRIVTYSTKPRGGVVHALSLAEALGDRGHDVELWALSADGAAFFRPPGVPARLVPVERRPGEDVEPRILRYAETLAGGLRAAGPADVHHAEDCLSARSLLALRADGRIPAVVRTVHHVDDFASPVLAECQRASIEDVDHRICVSRHWADAIERDHGVSADVIPNGVDAARFASCPLGRAAAGARMGWGGRPVVLAVGGIEPRKGSRVLLQAFARARAALGPGALLAVAGGETLFDYADYRAAWEQDAARLALRVHRGPAPPPGADVAVLGPVADDDMPALYRGADVFAFPSEREGFGLVALEAMAAGLPVVASDLPVLREFLAPGEDCIMAPVGDVEALAAALVAAATDAPLRARLAQAGPATAARFTWAAAARAHEDVYRGLHVAA
jgi:glycosyltransferase-like protein